MRHLLLSLLILAATLCHASVQAQTRSFTDDLGRRVELPINPSRIVVSDEIYLTVPLLELGVTLAGSVGRGCRGAAPSIRSAPILTGKDFASTGMLCLGSDPLDVESVVAARPDLIITLVNRPTPPELLAQIAPTVVLDLTRRSPRAHYALLAELTGAGPRLAELEAQYHAGIELLRRVVAGRDLTVSLFDVTAAGKIVVRHTYGALGEVLRDAGLGQPDLIDRIPEMETVDLSPEILPDLDGDIIIGTWREDRPDSPETARAALEARLPDYCRFLSACGRNRMYFLPRELSRSHSYASRMMMISFLTGALSFGD